MLPPHLWLSSLEQNPISLQQQQHSALPELKIRKMTTVTMDLQLWSKFSSMTKLARVLAYCLRFVHLKHRIRDPLLTHPPALSSEELKKAHLKIVQHLQRKAWPDEFQQLSSKQPVLLSSPTAKLNPYLDSSGLIRVGGRLSKSKTLPAEVQHPILLPKTPFGQIFPAGLSPQTPPPWSLSHGSPALPVLLSCGMQADRQIRVQELRGMQKSPSYDHHPVYGRPLRPQNLHCQVI